MHSLARLSDEERRRVAAGSNARAERYWQLLGIIDGWPAIPSTMPAWEWFTAALRARG